MPKYRQAPSIMTWCLYFFLCTLICPAEIMLDQEVAHSRYSHFEWRGRISTLMCQQQLVIRLDSWLVGFDQRPSFVRLFIGNKWYWPLCGKKNVRSRTVSEYTCASPYRFGIKCTISSLDQVLIGAFTPWPDRFSSGQIFVHCNFFKNCIIGVSQG